jgi:hypothetical protein
MSWRRPSDEFPLLESDRMTLVDPTHEPVPAPAPKQNERTVRLVGPLGFEVADAGCESSAIAGEIFFSTGPTSG